MGATIPDGGVVPSSPGTAGGSGDLLAANNLSDVASVTTARANLRKQTDNTLTDAATVAVDASLGEHFNVTLGGNRTLGNPTNAPSAGQTQMIVIRVVQDATGSRTLAYDTQYAFSADIPSPTLSTGANKVDVLTFKWVQSASKWYLVAIVKGF